MRNDCRRIAEQVDIHGHNDPSLDILTLVQDWFESKESRRWLIVYVNADDIDIFYSKDGERLAQYFPRSAHGAILMTTRNRQVGVKFAAAKNVVNLEALCDAESCALITSKLSLEEEADCIDRLRLARTLSGIPLALTQATSFLQENGVTTIGRYLEMYDASDTERIELLSQDFEDNVRDRESVNSIAQTWAVTFEYLSQHQPLAARTLCLMSLLNSQAIPECLIAPDLSCSALELEKFFGVLQAHSLISLRCPLDQNLGRTFDLHRLVQLATRNWMRISGSYDRFLARAITILASGYEALFPIECSQERYIKARYLPHALELVLSPQLLLHEDEVVVPGIFQTQRLQSEDDLHKDPDSICSHCTAEILSEMYSHQWCKDQELSMIGKAIAILNHTLGPDHNLTVRRRFREAELLSYPDVGRFGDAEHIYRELLANQTYKLGLSKYQTVSTKLRLANVLIKQGHDTEAEHLLLQVTEYSKEQPEYRPWDNPRMSAIARLLELYIRQERTEEAFRFNSMLSNLASQPHELHDLAKCYFLQHEYTKAEEICVHLLEDDQALSRMPLAWIGTIWDTLKRIYKHQELLDKYEVILLKLVAIHKSAYGDQHSMTLSSINLLAKEYLDQDRYDECENLLKEYIPIEVKGHEDPKSVIDLRWVYAVLRHRQAWAAQHPPASEKVHEFT